MPKPADEIVPIQSARMSDHLVRLDRLLAHARLNEWSDAELARQIGRKQQQINAWRTGARLIGEKLARSLEERLSLPRFALDDRPTANTSVAHVVSEPAPRYNVLQLPTATATRSGNSVPVLPWHRLGAVHTMTNAERVALPQLTTFAPISSAAFFVTMPDDSMAPRIQAGDDLLFDPSEAPRAGDIILVSVNDDEHVVRIFRPKTAHLWEATAVNDQYLPLASGADGLTVVAVAVEHRSYLRRA